MALIDLGLGFYMGLIKRKVYNANYYINNLFAILFVINRIFYGISYFDIWNIESLREKSFTKNLKKENTKILTQ